MRFLNLHAIIPSPSLWQTVWTLRLRSQATEGKGAPGQAALSTFGSTRLTSLVPVP